MKVFLTLELRKSAKSGKLYPAFCADLGYRKVNLVVDRVLLSELFDLSPRKLSELFNVAQQDGQGYCDGDMYYPVATYDPEEIFK